MRILFLLFILISSLSCRKFVWDNPNDTNNPLTEPASLKNGLVAYYPFNGNANDESGNKKNGIVGGVSLGSDRFGILDKAYCFDGIDDYITIGLFNDPIITDKALTISAWIKTSANNPEQMNVINARGKGPTAFVIQPGNQITCTFSNSGGGFHNLDVNIINVKDDKWHHIIMMYNGTQKILYIDNILLGQADEMISLEVSGLLEFGRGNPFGVPSGSQYNGCLDDVRIYNRALTQEEITYLANN